MGFWDSYKKWTFHSFRINPISKVNLGQTTTLAPFGVHGGHSLAFPTPMWGYLGAHFSYTDFCGGTKQQKMDRAIVIRILNAEHVWTLVLHSLGVFASNPELGISASCPCCIIILYAPAPCNLFLQDQTCAHAPQPFHNSHNSRTRAAFRSYWYAFCSVSIRIPSV